MRWAFMVFTHLMSQVTGSSSSRWRAGRRGNLALCFWPACSNLTDGSAVRQVENVSKFSFGAPKP